MSYWEGTEYGERLYQHVAKVNKCTIEEAKKLMLPPGFEESDVPNHPNIPHEAMRRIWMKSCVWNDSILPHYFKGAMQGYLIAKAEFEKSKQG